jgi:SAM-dependent methyltransferase
MKKTLNPNKDIIQKTTSRVIMYDEIADIYLEIFPINRDFLAFIPKYIGHLGATVLDLGCGPGDYIDYLIRASYLATGIDNSPGMIAQARANKQGTFYQFSFTELDQLQGGFDCIYCVGNSLSYLPPQEMASFLKEILRLLNPSGHFILQVVNWDKYHLTGTTDFPVQKLSDGRSFHRRYERIDSTQVIFHTSIQKGDIILGAWAAPLYPKYQEAVVAEVGAVGLTIKNIFGDYQKTHFDPATSPAMILVTQKS